MGHCCPLSCPVVTVTQIQEDISISPCPCPPHTEEVRGVTSHVVVEQTFHSSNKQHKLQEATPGSPLSIFQIEQLHQRVWLLSPIKHSRSPAVHLQA